MNRVVDHLFVFTGEGVVRDFQGSYTEYLDYRRNRQTDTERDEPDEAVSSSKDPLTTKHLSSQISFMADSNKQASDSNQIAHSKNPTKRRELTYAERKEMNKIEREIEKQRMQIVEKERFVTENPTIGFSALAEVTADIERLKSTLEESEGKWLDYAEIAGNI